MTGTPPSIESLFLAYRQAKVALYFERRGVGLRNLAQFEARLAHRLARLQSTLKRNDSWFRGSQIGDVCLVPKRLRKPDQASNEVIEIGPGRRPAGETGLQLQLRLSPTPEFAIIEVLYLWRYGPLLDSLIPEASIGYRLELVDGKVESTKRWLFEYWRRRYQQYRTEPIAQAHEQLRQRGGVAILTADLATFYDTVSPDFMLTDPFVDQLKRKGLAEEEVDSYRLATRSLIAAYASFRQQAGQVIGRDLRVGVPIGALTSRLVANLALATFDSAVMSRADVLCYRRYVDDFVIVARSEPTELLGFDEMLTSFVPYLERDGEDWRLDTDALDRSGCELRLQQRKIKIHRLSGIQGQEYLGAIARDFGALVSESRAFLDSAVLSDGATARLFSVGKADGSPIRVLRDADRAKLQNFAVAIGLHSIEQVSLLLNVDEARSATHRSLQRLVTYLAGEADWPDHLDLAFRILGSTVAVANWHVTEELCMWMDKTWGSRQALRSSVGSLLFQNRTVETDAAWDNLRDYLLERRLEAVSSSVRADSKHRLPDWIAPAAPDRPEVSVRALVRLARTLAAADLRKWDREDDYEGFGRWGRKPGPLKITLGESFAKRMQLIEQFIRVCEDIGDSAWAIDSVRLFLSPRPPSYFDVARRWLSDVDRKGFQTEAFHQLLEVVNAVRGTRYSDPVGAVVDSDTVQVPAAEPFSSDDGSDPTVALGNLMLKPEYFDGSATRLSGSNVGKPVLTVERLIQLGQVLDGTARLCRSADGSPSDRACLLVLPELSLPRAWFRSTANHAIKTGRFGLVAGLEYLHELASPTVRSQVYVVLPGPFASVATWPFTKRLPAREEADLLSSRRPPLAFPLVKGSPRKLVVVDSRWGRLSVLICSELIEVQLVAGLLGRAELIVAPSWNTDTASYDHLIQSVGLQLHAIVAVANNAHYSDCRVWAPLKVRWRRDLCRLIERGTASIVSVEIPLNSLRQFHREASMLPGLARRNGSQAEWRPLPPDWPEP